TLGVAALGCSHTVPSELHDARTAYERAARSPGASLVPGDMADARNSLNVAERQFSENGDDASTRDLSYVAGRRAIAAGAKAGAARAPQQKQTALADLEQTRRRQAASKAAELEHSKAELAAAQQRVESERQARIVAEEQLSKIKDLKTERSDRGLIVTISGQ